MKAIGAKANFCTPKRTRVALNMKEQWALKYSRSHEGRHIGLYILAISIYINKAEGIKILISIETLAETSSEPQLLETLAALYSEDHKTISAPSTI